MLEDRGVVPIDLARHPKVQQWPEHLCHEYATRWVLHTLENGKPYDQTNWPSILEFRIRSDILELLQPIESARFSRSLNRNLNGSGIAVTISLDESGRISASQENNQKFGSTTGGYIRAGWHFHQVKNEENLVGARMTGNRQF